jgi:hypothetical protein
MNMTFIKQCGDVQFHMYIYTYLILGMWWRLSGIFSDIWDVGDQWWLMHHFCICCQRFWHSL